MSLLETVVRLALSLLLALPIGWEREAAQKAAGLRTHLLVSLGCCLFTLSGISLAGSWKTGATDPGRVAAQVVTGIGFLGGGAILRGGGVVRGLTTAASIWTVAAIGMACGAGYYGGAAVGSVGTFIVLRGVERWERRFLGVKKPVTLRIHVRGDRAMERVKEILESLEIRPTTSSIETEGDHRILTVSGNLETRSVSFAFQELGGEPDVLVVERVES